MLGLAGLEAESASAVGHSGREPHVEQIKAARDARAPPLGHCAGRAIQEVSVFGVCWIVKRTAHELGLWHSCRRDLGDAGEP